MKSPTPARHIVLTLSLCALTSQLNALTESAKGELQLLAYNNPALLVSMGVGPSVPLPLDYNHDGLMDMLLMCPAVPHNGTWYCENSGTPDPETGLPTFKPPVRIGDAVNSPVVSYATGQRIITTLGARHPEFDTKGFSNPVNIPAPKRIHLERGNIRQNHWVLVDFEYDGDLDLTVGIDYWGVHEGSATTYGWEAAYDENGQWTNGPLHGYIYLLRNIGNDDSPLYSAPVKLTAGGEIIDTYGMPSPMWGDFDGDHDLDLICGEFLDSFTYFENTGTRTAPVLAQGRKLHMGSDLIQMDLCMIKPMAIDFNQDGRLDIICGDEDGRVAFIENLGKITNGLPQFSLPRYLRQHAEYVNFGILSTPYAFDWNNDGRIDIITGCSGGYVGFIENLGGTPTRWAAPVYLEADGKTIREQAGPNGSIQGPAEAKWGYSIPCVADWDQDGLPDLITNGIWGKILWYKNIGTREEPALSAAQPVRVAPNKSIPAPEWNWWEPEEGELVTQWRTMPEAIDWNNDGLIDLVMLDHEGYLALFERVQLDDGSLAVLPGKRVFWGKTQSRYSHNGLPDKRDPGLRGPLLMNYRLKGGSGRRTFCIDDWDADGILDLLVNSDPNINLLKGLGQDENGNWMFEDMGPVSQYPLAHHATKPTTADWNGDGLPELLIGAEDGFFYHMDNPLADPQ